MVLDEDQSGIFHFINYPEQKKNEKIMKKLMRGAKKVF